MLSSDMSRFAQSGFNGFNGFVSIFNFQSLHTSLACLTLQYVQSSKEHKIQITEKQEQCL